MDDVLVIILTLVVAVFGALNQRKKRKEALNKPAAPATGQSQDFWDMLLDDDNYVQEDVPTPVREEVAEVETAPESKPVYEFKADREAVHSIKQPMKKLTKTKRKKLVMGEEFSLKKAVIYSEIINRKYV